MKMDDWEKATGRECVHFALDAVKDVRLKVEKGEGIFEGAENGVKLGAYSAITELINKMFWEDEDGAYS